MIDFNFLSVELDLYCSFIFLEKQDPLIVLDTHTNSLSGFFIRTNESTKINVFRS